MDTAAKTAHLTTFQPKGHLKDQAFDAELYARVGGVPEHSVSLMARASNGRAFREGNYLFLADRDWLLGIGFPLEGAPGSAEEFDAALKSAISRSGARDIRVAAPSLPKGLAGHTTKRDEYYLLDLAKPVPKRLASIATTYGPSLRVEKARVFTPAHRRLWGEFLTRNTLPANVQALYTKVEELFNAPDCEVFALNAWTEENRLAACLVVDTFMPGFDTYLLGAHSKEFYAPHASDVLFARMIEEARNAGKNYLHLGLGVNQGIARFKRKWGGFAAFPYVEGQWQEAKKSVSVNVILHSLEASMDLDMDERERREHDYAQRPFRMLWKLEKNGRTSWIGGTSHFFSKSFEQSFKKLYRHIDTVLFEGHLDDASLEKVSLAGKTPPEPSECLYNLLTEEERHNLERIVRGPEGFWARLLNIEAPNKADVGWYLRRTRHWYAFFALWCAYLERSGWKYSVDLEAWRIAQAEGKRILAMEDIEEQIDALRAVPVQRAVNFLKDCNNWPKYRKANEKAYLAGDLLGLSGTTTEFPTRTGHIIGKRDQRFRERMLPYLEAGNALALVGSAHLLNLRSMLEEDGFAVTACNRGFFSKIKA